MKTLALAVLALALPAAALAQYEPAEVHVVVSLDPSIDSLIAAEFRITNLPWESCLIEEQWDSPLTIGTIEWGFAIAFSEAQAGPLVHLGTLRFTAFEPVGSDYIMWVGASNWGNLCIVDEDGIEHPAMGWFHAFNCEDWCDCWYPDGVRRSGRDVVMIYLSAAPDQVVCDQDLPVFPTAAGEASWGAVKALY